MFLFLAAGLCLLIAEAAKPLIMLTKTYALVGGQHDTYY